MCEDSHNLPHASTRIVWDKVGERCFRGVYDAGNSLPLHHEAILCLVFQAFARGSHTAPTNFDGLAGVQGRALSFGGGR